MTALPLVPGSTHIRNSGIFPSGYSVVRSFDSHEILVNANIHNLSPIRKPQDLNTKFSISFENEKLFYVPGETIKGFVNLDPKTTYSYDHLRISMEGVVMDSSERNFFLMFEKFDDTFPTATPGLDCPNDNVALAG